MYECDKEWNVKPIQSKEQAGPPVALHRLVGRVRRSFWARMAAWYERREDAAYDEAQHCAGLRKFCQNRLAANKALTGACKKA